MKKSNQQKGNAFEKYISSIYESLNFAVTLNKSISGQQVDIYAEKMIPGMGLTKLIIECKYLESGSVSNQTVFDFNAFIKSMVFIDNSIKGVIVTNRDFSKDSKQAAESFNISLITERELESEVFDVKEPFLKIITSYERHETNKEFVSLYGNISGNNRKTQDNQDLMSKILNLAYFEWKKITFISVLADYGSGKTTLLKRLNYFFSKKHLEGEKIKPIYLELKNFERYRTLKSFLVSSFIKLFQREISYETILIRINNGDFIFLLDGFDEMSPQVDRTKRIENLHKLSPILLSKSNSIITCRPSYFISKKEFEAALDVLIQQNRPISIEQTKSPNLSLLKKNKQYQNLYQNLVSKYSDSDSITKESSKIGSDAVVMNIYPFNDTQIDKYLENFEEEFQRKCNNSWKQIKDFLIGIYDISDLLKKPILLSMIKDTILELGDEYSMKNEVFDPVSLYETYTKANLCRDYNKGISRQLLTNEQRDKFAESIAYFMFETDVLSIDYDNLFKLAQKKEEIVSEIEFVKNLTIEEIASDIQVCTFIQRTESDKFKFIHKSFMEFYVARQLKRSIKKNNKSVLENKMVQKEILAFIGGYTFSDIKLKDKIVKIISAKSNKKSIYKRNIFLAYLLASNYHLKLNGLNIGVNLISLDNIIFENCKLHNIEFIYAELENIFIKNKSQVDFKLENTSLNGFKISNASCSFKKMDKHSSGDYDYRKFKIGSSKVKFDSDYNVYLSSGFVYNSKLSINSKLFQIKDFIIKQSELYMYDLDFDLIHSIVSDSNLIFEYSSRDRKSVEIRFNNSILKNLKISINKDVIQFYFIECTFIDVHFDNVNISPFLNNTIDKNQFINCSGSIIANDFSEKSNYSFIDENHQVRKMNFTKINKLQFGDLEIIVKKRNSDLNN